MADFHFSKGFDIPLAGKPASDLVAAPSPKTIALRPSNFRGVKLRLLVKEGDRVRTGEPLLHSKGAENWRFCSPATGVIKTIERGFRRRLEAIVIEPEEPEYVEFRSWNAKQLASADRGDLIEQLLASGMLALFRERPFDYVANPAHEPRDIFISCFDSSPLAADYQLLIKGNEDAFRAGIDVCRALTKGRVHIGIDGKLDPCPKIFSELSEVETHRFSGPHPAGTIGVQIHHIKPVLRRNDIVWYITVQGVILLGRLFMTATLNLETVVAVGGSSVKTPRHYRTVLGADVDTILKGHLQDGIHRVISGNVLTGTQVDPAGPQGHVGFYDSQIAVIPEATDAEFCGWMLPGFNKISWFRAFTSRLLPGRALVQDTRMHGGRRAMVVTGAYDAVLPMDILPEYLIKSCLAQDIDEMEQLGLYEVAEEEFALCEYICPSKIPIQQIIRDGLEKMAEEA